MDMKRNWTRAPHDCPGAERKTSHYLWSMSAGIVLAGVLAFTFAGTRRTSAAPAPPATKVEVPKFAVDPSWPHIPNGWTLGQVSSAATDADGNIWIIHRREV